MLKLFGRTKEDKAAVEFLDSPIGKILVQHTTEYFGSGKIFGNATEEAKLDITGQLFERGIGIAQAENPFLQMRFELVAQVLSYAKITVLSVKTPDIPDIFKSPYVSGKLHTHIRQCAPHYKGLEEQIWQNPNISDADLVAFAAARSLICLYFMNGINMVRAEFDDINDDHAKDWFRPFVKSMLIFDEDDYRSKINLPSLLPGGAIDALQHSSFMSIVRNGERNPLFEWERAFKIEHAKPLKA
jgi:hypothetical protein